MEVETMAKYGQLLVDPSYRKSLIAATHKTATVEMVYDNGLQYVSILRTDDGKRYTHEVPKGSESEKAKCEAFGVTHLRDMTGKTLDVYLDGNDVVAAKVVSKQESYRGVF